MLGQYVKVSFQTDIVPSSYRIHHGLSDMVSELEKEYQKKKLHFIVFVIIDVLALQQYSYIFLLNLKYNS
jgi:hypothetical protein